MDTVTAVVPGMRTTVMKLVVNNKSGKELTMPLQVEYRGHTRKEDNWKFPIPAAGKGSLDAYAADGRVLSAVEHGLAFRLTSSLENMRMFGSVP